MSRKVLVTGGTGSVGRKIVESLLLNDYNVTFQYCTNDNLANELKTFAHKQSKQCRAIKLDFLTYDLPKNELKDVDVLINNAAFNYLTDAVNNIEWNAWDQHIFLNLTIPFRLASIALHGMIQRGYGRIININSIFGIRATEYRGAYSASKHGLSGLTKCIAKEYGKYGVTANEICPCAIESEMLDKIAASRAIQLNINEEEYMKNLRSEIPVGRLCTAEDVCQVILFLISDKASFINGASIGLDGGQCV